MASARQRASGSAWASTWMLLVLLCLSMGGGSSRRLHSTDASDSDPPPTEAAPADGEPPAIPSLQEMLADAIIKKLPEMIPKNLTLDKIFHPNLTMHQMFDSMKNISLPKLMENITLENGMTTLEFMKALMTGTISSNTADTNTPDKGLSDVQSGAININPFMDGASMSNALTLAGRDATANSRGIVFGLVGTGRSSSQATALGRTGAKSSTDTFVINGGGVNQNAMSSNLAVTPQGAAETSVRAASFDIVGSTTSGGLTNAIGKKGASSAGLGATMTGLGDSYGAQFANSLSEGATSSNTGVIAGSLTGATKSTVGSVSTSLKRSADSRALSTTKAGLGSSHSKAASVSTAAQNATSMAGSYSHSGVGNSASISSTDATGLNADATAESTSETQAGAASSFAISKARGVNSASSASNATSKPSSKGVRDPLLLGLHLKLPSVTFTSSSSSSNNLQSPGWGLGKLFGFLAKPAAAAPALPTTAPLLGEALVSTVGLKALLPSVPKIIPQLPTLNQTITVNATPTCNETELNSNRTSNETWLTCNSTANSSAPSAALPSANLPGLSFFDNLKKLNTKFMEDNVSPSPSPSPSPATKAPSTPTKKPGSKPSGSGGGGGAGSGSSSVKSSPKPGGGSGSNSRLAASPFPAVKSSPKPGVKSSPKPGTATAMKSSPKPGAVAAVKSSPKPGSSSGQQASGNKQKPQGSTNKKIAPGS